MSAPLAAPRALAAADLTAARAERSILDVRDETAFRAGHLATSGHVPAADFAARHAELPPRSVPLLVVADTSRAAADAAARLTALGFADVRWLDAPLAAVPGGLAATGPGERLWRQTPFLADVLPSLPRGRAADVAAGAGRDAVFLALHGFDVEAWDADEEALARAAALGERHGVRLATVACDLETPGAALPAGRYALVTCFRFLHRPLLPALARALAPGGHLVIETFRRGQEKFGKPHRPQFLLEPGELRAAFPELEVLHAEEPEPPGGPITSRLHARRPAHPPTGGGA